MFHEGVWESHLWEYQVPSCKATYTFGDEVNTAREWTMLLLLDSCYQEEEAEEEERRTDLLRAF